jgi:DinB superfamily
MLTPEERQQMIDTIRQFPAEFEALVAGLSDADLNTHFLADEWTVAQNVHHVPDSHMNAFIRLKLALTEDQPIIKPYDQDKWAELADYDLPLESSQKLLRALHERWCALWESLDEADWARTWRHPELEPAVQTVEDLLKIYDNHCKAHLDQVRRTLAAKEA